MPATRGRKNPSPNKTLRSNQVAYRDKGIKKKRQDLPQLKKNQQFARGVRATHDATKGIIRSAKGQVATLNKMQRQFSQNSLTYNANHEEMLQKATIIFNQEKADQDVRHDSFIAKLHGIGFDTGQKSRAAPKKSAEEMEAEWRLAVANGSSGLGHDITTDLFKNMEWSEMQVVIRALQCSLKRDVPYKTMEEAVEKYKAVTSKKAIVPSSVEFPNDGTPSNFVNAFNTVVNGYGKIIGLQAAAQEVTAKMVAGEKAGTPKTMQGFLTQLYKHPKAQELMAQAVPFMANLRLFCAQNDKGVWAPKDTDDVSSMATALMLLVGYKKKIVLHTEVGGTKTVRIQKIKIAAQSEDPAEMEMDGMSSDGKMPQTPLDAYASDGVPSTDPNNRHGNSSSDSSSDSDEDGSSDSSSDSDEDGSDGEGSKDRTKDSDQYQRAPSPPPKSPQ